MNNPFGQVIPTPIEEGGNHFAYSSELQCYINCLEVVKQGGSSEAFQKANTEIQRITQSSTFPSLFMYRLRIEVYF